MSNILKHEKKVAVISMLAESGKPGFISPPTQWIRGLNLIHPNGR
jgi:hypothetical protein